MGAKDKNGGSAKQPTQAEKDLAGADAAKNVGYIHNVNVAGMPKADSTGNQAHWDLSAGGGAAKEDNGADNVLFPNDRVVDNEPEVFELFIDEITGAETHTDHTNGSDVDADALTRNIKLAFETMHKRVGEMKGGKKPWQLGEFHLGFERDNRPVFDVGRNTFFVSSNSDSIYFGANVNTEFRKEAQKVARNIGVDVNYLMTIMAFETGETFSPSVKNKAGSGATGLIQFMKMTAKKLGTSTDELSKMTNIEQLKYVEKYFTPYKGKLHTIEDAYMAVLYPAAVGKPNDYVLFKENDKKTGKAYEQNKGLDTDHNGVVTKYEVSKVIRKKYEKGAKHKN